MDVAAPSRSELPSWVALGTIGRTGRAAIDRRGTMVVEGGRWALDWWAGAEDRWHRNRDDGVVRQRAEDATPVIVSGLRLPGGELEQRAWAVADPGRVGGGSVLVVEFHNATPVAIALALAVRPIDDGIGVDAIDLSGRTVTIDGGAALTFAKDPSRIATSTSGIGATFDAITSDRATSEFPIGGVRSSSGSAAAAFVFPLPHTATLRVVIGLPESTTYADGTVRRMSWPSDASFDTDAVPEAERVVGGWRSQTSRAPRFELPERDLEEIAALAQRHLLVHAAGTDPIAWPGEPVDGRTRAALCMALDDAGLHAESARLLRSAIDLQRTNGAFDDDRLDATASWLVAIGHHTALSGDRTLAGELVGQIAGAAHWLWRRQRGRRLRGSTRFFAMGSGPIDIAPTDRVGYDARWTARAYRSAIDTLRAVDQRDAAMVIERHAVDLALSMGGRSIPLDGPGSAAPPFRPMPEVRDLLAEGSPLATWATATDGHDPSRTAAFLTMLRDAVVDDSDGAVAMVPVLDDEWFGTPLAVHALPTALGRLSFAVRWHGMRPALLWDLEPHPGVDVELRAPGLDPSWSSREPRGEALLAAPEVPAHIHVHDHRDRPHGDDPGGGSFS